MRASVSALSVLLGLMMASGLPAQSRTIAERLGHPPDAKLLIIHADDLAVAHSVNAASFDALDRGAVSSASIMVPCPWLTEVAGYAKAHPDADLGLHLTLTSEWRQYKWGSVASSDTVPSLLDPSGHFWYETPPAAAHAKPAEVEGEVRAQIERARAVGIRPTHLDSHMGTLFATPELFATYARVAREYKLPFLAIKGAGAAALQSSLLPTDVVLDSLVIAGPQVPRDKWKEFYVDAIKSLKPGLTELIVHLGHDNDELRAVTVDHDDYGSAWRQRDYDVVTSREFRTALADNDVIVIKWKDLQGLVGQP